MIERRVEIRAGREERSKATSRQGKNYIGGERMKPRRETWNFNIASMVAGEVSKTLYSKVSRAKLKR